MFLNLSILTESFRNAQMSWSQNMDSHYMGSNAPYNSAGSFMDFFAGLTYDHVNFIFSGSQIQDCTYSSPLNTGYYKFGYSEPGAAQYYSSSPAYEVFDHIVGGGIDEYTRRPADFPSNEQTTAANNQPQRMSDMSNRDCPRSRHSSQDYQVIWQDNIDPDNMTYEELLELGETVGTHSRGLSQEQIALLPVTKYKCCFLRKKSRSERCVICQMEYKRKDRLITLPCKHKYHLACGTKWLSINKACPICYTEVFADATKKFK